MTTVLVSTDLEKLKTANQHNSQSMKTSIQSNVIRVAVVLLLAVMAIGQMAQAQTPVLQLKSANFNPNTGLWTATVGANAQATGTFPTLANNVSPNGSPAVVFNGANQLDRKSTRLNSSHLGIS